MGENISSEKKFFRIHGSFPASAIIKAVDDHLKSFGVDMSHDIVATTNDDAAVMVKFARDIEPISQLCINHGIHLGICDTLYKRPIANAEFSECDSDDGSESFDDDGVEFLDDTEDQENTEPSVEYFEVLSAVRTVVNFIRGGTLREQYFQSKVKEAFGVERELVKDVKHRWNSIPGMLEPVVKYKVQIIDTCNGFKESEMANGLDFEAIENLLNGVVPVKLAVEALSRQDATLVIADKTIEFLYDKLQQQNNGISTSLLENLKVRISERMNENVKNLLRCLKNPNKSLTTSDLRFAKELLVRLFHIEPIVEQEDIVFTAELKQPETSWFLTVKPATSWFLKTPGFCKPY